MPVILYVDDDAASRWTMRKLLEHLGYEIVVASSGHEALNLIRERDIALAIIDYMMPGMHGLDLFKQIQKCSPETRSIFLTGYLTPESTEAALRAGVERVVAKPMGVEMLVPLLSEYLGENRPAGRSVV
ncbi:MAG: response regulator [Planctomycetes bacterium]|nr:response regulator [Planctomycetota bacterium]